MNISFGIPLAPDYVADTLQTLVNSIQYQPFDDKSKFEIIVCGEYRNDIRLAAHTKLVHIPFDETVKSKWITKKKNDIVDACQYEHVCILHDYYRLGASWFDSFERFKREHKEWDVVCNPILTAEMERHSDWLVNQKYMDLLLKEHPELAKGLMEIAPHENGPRWVCGLPYNELDLSHIQYVSGGYIFAKKRVFDEVPFDEQYAWGEAAEDIIWSENVIEKGFKIRLNRYGHIFLQKPGKWRLYNMTPECIEKLKEMFPSESV